MGDRCERDLFNVSLVDTVLLDELELLSRLMVAANGCEDQPVATAIDALLAAPANRADSRASTGCRPARPGQRLRH